jgi:hypothetical protein
LLEVEEFSATAKTRASFGECVDEERPVLGYAPVTSGVTYPLFVWSVGTLAIYDSPEVFIILREMAKRGFVAVSASYDTFVANSCANIREKTMCIFDPTLPDSLTSRMCARRDVDCSKGIVVGGHSQGSQISLVSKSYDSRVRAHWGMSANCDFLFNQDTGLCNPDGENDDTTCLLHSETLLPTDRIRFVNGEGEEYGTEVDYERMSGKGCPPGTLDCLDSDGSGWYRIANTMVQDGFADHCYIMNSTDGAWCPGLDAAHPFDTGWIPPAGEEWSLLTNLDWLAGFADR